ncbi:hypothetical protein [Sphingomonas sp. HMP6]|uniref:hypothetical protein n=1 Tax=Sphingomonas sp. HMP6 TaxID=1517551 RepID=UPI001596623F|nr:hypothetical protein [Sphingomonas sp. HMP6]BCA59037.1 hypothetical protein HMP06_1806 [Sphingomonas sp. HMP6]
MLYAAFVSVGAAAEEGGSREGAKSRKGREGDIAVAVACPFMSKKDGATGRAIAFGKAKNLRALTFSSRLRVNLFF